MSAPRSAGGVVSLYKKYTTESVGFWEKIRRFFAIDPNRSSGVPLNPAYRNPAPGSVSAITYEDPVSFPAGDIAENPYWKRDVRRNYSRTAVFAQNDIAGLLVLGNVTNPRIGKGEKGAKQLVAIKEGGVLAQVLENKDVAKEVLGKNGMPPLPGKHREFKQLEGSYSSEYPCRSFA